MTALRQIHGDWFDAGPRLPSNHFHGVVADVPYLYAFMSRDFDRQHRHWPGSTDGERAFNWNLDVCRELYRVLVPGAIALIFQGARTYHRLAYAAEVAGFEVLPMVCGIVGSAMAQGGNVGKLVDRERRDDIYHVTRFVSNARDRAGLTNRAIDEAFGFAGMAGHWTSQKSQPAVPTWEQWQALRELLGGREVVTGAAVRPLATAFDGHHTRIRDQLMPVAVLMKPVDGSFARNAARWGVAGFDVDGARIETADDNARSGDPRDAALYGGSRRAGRGHARGRFPGNVLLDEAAAEEVGEMSGWSSDGDHGAGARVNKNKVYGPHISDDRPGYGGHGTAARYFRRFRYVARAPTSERVRGLEHWHWIGDPQHPEGWRRLSTAEAIEVKRERPRRLMTGSNHPTLKPLELTRWAARLILPPAHDAAREIRERTTGSPGRLLVPFSGVLSEAIGAALAGWWEIVAVELSDSYVAQGAARWRAWGPYSPARPETVRREPVKDEAHPEQATLFGEDACS